MAPAVRRNRKSCRVSRRLAELDTFLNDEMRDRITDAIREQLDVRTMVVLLNEEGWAGVVAALPSRFKKIVFSLADELEAEVLAAVHCVQRCFRSSQKVKAVPVEHFFIGDVSEIGAQYEDRWA